MNTTKNNKLIAEFMGMITSENDSSMMIFKTPNGNDIIYLDELKYHTSWDWLMPVMKKIGCYANEELSFAEYDDYRNKYAFVTIAPTLCTTNIELAYNEVVEFIKEYNVVRLNATLFTLNKNN